MEELKHELDMLIQQLVRRRPAAGSQEAHTLQHLQAIQALLEGGGDPPEMATAFTALKQFWLDTIAWCSPLSRDVEKLIIIHAECSEAVDRQQP